MAQMDYAGVDKAIVQGGGVYGSLNSYFAMIMDELPEVRRRVFFFAGVNESKAYTDHEIQELRTLVLDLGMAGLFFSASESSFNPRFAPFWEEVCSLGIPITWSFFPSKEVWYPLLEKLGRWVEDYPSTDCILSMAFPLLTKQRDDKLDLPRFVDDVMAHERIVAEIVYPITRGAVEDYPFPISREAIHTLYEKFGPRSLVWGSDIPMVERYCTYGQSLDYLRKYCPFIPKDDMDMILGGNLQRIVEESSSAKKKGASVECL